MSKHQHPGVVHDYGCDLCAQQRDRHDHVAPGVHATPCDAVEEVIRRHDDQIARSQMSLREVMGTPGVHHVPTGLMARPLSFEDDDIEQIASSFETIDSSIPVYRTDYVERPVPPNPSRRQYVVEKSVINRAPIDPVVDRAWRRIVDRKADGMSEAKELAWREIEAIEIANGLDPKVFEDSPKNGLPIRDEVSWSWLVFVDIVCILVGGLLLLLAQQRPTLGLLGGALLGLPIFVTGLRANKEGRAATQRVEAKQRTMPPPSASIRRSGLEQLSGPKPNVAERPSAIVQRDY